MDIKRINVWNFVNNIRCNALNLAFWILVSSFQKLHRFLNTQNLPSPKLSFIVEDILFIRTTFL